MRAKEGGKASFVQLYSIYGCVHVGLLLCMVYILKRASWSFGGIPID